MKNNYKKWFTLLIIYIYIFIFGLNKKNWNKVFTWGTFCFPKVLHLNINKFWPIFSTKALPVLVYFKKQLYQLNGKIRKKDEKIKKIKNKKTCLILYSCYSVNSNKNGHILKHLHKNVKCNVNNYRSHGRKSIAKKKNSWGIKHIKMLCNVFKSFNYLFYRFSTIIFFFSFSFAYLNEYQSKFKSIKIFFPHINVNCLMYMHVFLQGNLTNFN